MGKHAYLIIAHGKWKQLQFLISLLNDTKNDFFILVDAKAKDFDKKLFKETCCSKQLYFAEPMKIYWGDFTQTLAQYVLLKKAIETDHYDYYHLISAVDMPLKSQEEIHRFFDENKGYEFVNYYIFNDSSLAKERIGYYYLGQKFIGRRRKDILKLLRDFCVVIQKHVGVNRVKDIEHYLGKGSNWYSITDGFARFIVDNEEILSKHFAHSFCSDEVFIQTMLKMSPYIKNWYGFKNRELRYQNLRYTDWGRGKPYTFKKDEFFSLCNGPYLFARKFSDDIVSEDVRKKLGK